MVLGLIPDYLSRFGHQCSFVGCPTLVLSHHIRMRITDMTRKQLLSVPCPTCGVAAGQRCVLHSGRLRKEPHVDRKLWATEAVVKQRR
jgi:hypothetical protein